MTEELRLVLLLGGILIFGYIIWDAKRRQKKDSPNNNSIQTDSKTNSPPQVQQKKPTLDVDGYDDLGLTQVRIMNGPDLKNDQVLKSKPRHNPEQQKAQESEPEVLERVEPSFDGETTTETQSIPQPIEEVLSTNLEDIIIPSKTDETLQDSSNLETMQKPETVITINIMAEDGSEFSGSSLLQELLTLGFKYGEMGVFHRYQNANGQGERWFCLANAINPGSFDLDNMEQFTTPGLTLFMLLPGPQKPLEAFENMINAANKLQSCLGGKLEDGSHSALTQQRVQHYREEILNFQRQHLAKINHPKEP